MFLASVKWHQMAQISEMQRNFEQPVKGFFLGGWGTGGTLFISTGLERKESVKFGVALIHMLVPGAGEEANREFGTWTTDVW